MKGGLHHFVERKAYSILNGKFADCYGADITLRNVKGMGRLELLTLQQLMPNGSVSVKYWQLFHPEIAGTLTSHPCLHLHLLIEGLPQSKQMEKRRINFGSRLALLVMPMVARSCPCFLLGDQKNLDALKSGHQRSKGFTTETIRRRG